MRLTATATFPRQRDDKHPHMPQDAHGRLARARAAFEQLAPESIEQIALRVAALLRDRPAGLAGDSFDAAVANAATADSGPPTGADDGNSKDGDTVRSVQPASLLTATQLAKRLGVSRSWVYEHARKLGAISLGDGPKARLRFDLETALHALADRQDVGGPSPIPPRGGKARQRPYRHLPDLPPDTPLLPINRPGLRGILSAWTHRRHPSGR